MDFIFFLTLFCFILIFGSLDNSIDFDFWARLIVGKNFFETGGILKNDFLSFGTRHEFIDHEWGSSLIFYIIQKHFGDIGLFVFKSFMIFITLFIIIKIIRLENKKIPLYFLFFFFTIQSISYNIFSTIRCQTFSFFFFVFYLYILKYAQKNKNFRILYCIPLLNIIWTNLHGGFVLGLASIFIFALGEYLNKKEYKPYAITFFASLLTCLINPYGIKYLIYIFQAITLNRTYIPEWQSAFFSKTIAFTMIKFKVFFFVSWLLFIYSNVKKLFHIKNLKEYYLKIDKTKYLLIIFCSIIALKSLRCHVFYTYCVCALCYFDFYNIFNKKLPVLIDKSKEIILFILIFISTMSHLWDYKFLNKISEEYPYKPVEFIKINNLKGNVFTIFHAGSYVSYKLYPNNHIFMDGRYEEVYDNNLINKMSKFYLGKNTDNFLDEFYCDIYIIEKNYPVFDKLKTSKKLFLAYEDSNFGVFLLNTNKNKNFLKPKENKEYYYKTKFDNNFNMF